jgi:hypothetical protein
MKLRRRGSAFPCMPMMWQLSIQKRREVRRRRDHRGVKGLEGLWTAVTNAHWRGDERAGMGEIIRAIRRAGGQHARRDDVLRAFLLATGTPRADKQQPERGAWHVVVFWCVDRRYRGERTTPGRNRPDRPVGAKTNESDESRSRSGPVFYTGATFRRRNVALRFSTPVPRET